MGVVAVLIGLPLTYAGHALSDTNQFSARATSLLARPSVRAVIATRVSQELVTSQHIPAAFTPLLDRAVGVAIGAPAFRPIFKAALADLHRSVFDQGSDTVTLRLANVGKVIEDALKQYSPALAAQIPRSVTDHVIEISGGDFGQATRVARAIAGAHAVGVVLLVAGLLLLLGYLLSRSLVVNQFAPGDDRNAARAVWDVFLSGLRSDAVLLAGAGAVVAVVMWVLRPRRRRPGAVPISAGAGAGRGRARPGPRR